MWHAQREAFMFWGFAGLCGCVALFLVGKSLLTHVLQQRAARRQDEHATHLGIG
jgi:inner membrane protein involved in colicin E2 resistance